MVSVPERGLVLLLAATEYRTPPFPLPLAPELIVIQSALLVAVQVQPPGADTTTVASPPLAGNDCEPVQITYMHPAASACVTVNVCPAIVSVPARLPALLLAAAV